jgi:hypothetical protein
MTFHRGPYIFAVLIGGASLLAGCNGDSAPTESAEGAAGVVATDSSTAANTSTPGAAPGGGPVGQVPTTGVAAAPTVEISPGDGAPSSASSGNPPNP